MPKKYSVPLANKKLVWKDPDPIPGNDYTITTLVLNEDGETATIRYGDGSEAEVYLHEIYIEDDNQ